MLMEKKEFFRNGFLRACHIYLTVFEKTNQLVRNQLLRSCGNSCSSTKTLMEKKRVLLEDEASDWLQI